MTKELKKINNKLERIEFMLEGIIHKLNGTGGIGITSTKPAQGAGPNPGGSIE